MPKEFLYRGKTLEELRKLEIREFARYLPSREKRSLLRQFDKIEIFLGRCREKIKTGKIIRTHNRDVIIIPEMVGMTICIHNGKTFEKILIEGEMIGHRLGEFALTRKKVEHSAPGIGATRSSAALSVK